MSKASILRLAACLSVAVLAGCSKQAREDRLFARAEKDFAAGDYDKAEVEYRGALQIVADPKAIARLGILYDEEGRALQAIPYLRKAADLSPDRIDVRVKLGLAYLELGGHKEAREAAKRALSGDPANEDALLLLMASSQTKQDADETRKLVEDLRRTHPDAAGYHVVLGTLLMAQGDQPGAEAEFRKAIELDPKSAAARVEMGNLFALRRDAKQAEDAYRTAAGLAPFRSTLRLRYVDFLLATGKSDEAKKELAEINGKAPDYIPGLVYSMKLALSERRYADCDAFIQKIVSRDMKNYDALLERGMLKQAQGDSAAAVDELKKAEDAYGRSPQIKYQLALTYLGNGDIVKAEDRLKQAIAVAPGYDQARLVLAELDLRKGNAAAAVEALTGLIQRHPQLSQAYLLLARAYVSEKSLDQALATYRRMAEVFPKDPQVPYFTGMLLAQQNRVAEARASFEQAIQISPDYGPAQDMLVNVDLTGNHVDAAEARVRELIKKYPKTAAPWLFQAKVDLVRKDMGATESDLLKAIDLDPNSQAAYFELAQLYLSTQKTEKAVAELKALADKTQNIRALMQLGMLHSSLKQFEAARTDYERALASNPKFAPALNNLAFLYAEKLGKLDMAYDLAKRARDSDPENPDTADTLGWILYRRGDYHGALVLVQECALKAPNNVTAQYHLGVIHYMLGEEDLARQAFQRTLAVAGADADATTLADARRRLAVLALDPATADSAVLADLQTRIKAEPNDPIVLIRLAGIEARRGASSDAAEHFETALKLAPRNTQIMLELAQLCAGKLGDPGKARALVKSAHELAPNDARISETLGLLLYRTGDYRWSMDLLQQAAQSLPEELDLQYDLARAQYASGRVSEAEDTLGSLLQASRPFPRRDEAGQLAALITAGKSPAQAEAKLADARKALAADPSSIPAMMVSGMALEGEGKPSGAAEAYEKILAQDPVFSPATRELALIYATHAGDDQRAYDMALKARSAFPEDPDVATALGIVDYRKGDFPGAVRVLQDSLRRRSGDAETRYYLGMAQYKAKDIANAKKELRRALEGGLVGADAEEAKKVLGESGKSGAAK